MNTKILVVEDDAAITHLLDVSLTLDYYEVITATNGKDADFQIRSKAPDIILLDLGLPDIDGLELIKRIRQTFDIPIIVISARLDEQTIVEALDNGANDYMTKPFNVDELRARIRVVQRLENMQNQKEIVFENGPLVVSYQAKTAQIDNQLLNLTPHEFALLELLCRHVGKVLTYDTILKAIYGYVNQSEMPSLRVHITSLRNKLTQAHPESKQLIITRPRIGYQMQYWQ
ncbi:response regulator transcription factor [Staphylococcus pseudintermedius]|uniref:response regulator transcription factor n=1 Tax=Staphylococcus pseudintermedius TaxID=283734 RepID=UPI00111F2562|nr:response regulator transcription factor [Staphylococcus pseudintermedius]MDF0179981.1 response regulator transcription factor [Staphylococcus pseudintermedius]MDF0273106.1 response regulator transcription factor [Staphylococcus pseudintermedius]MDF0279492.1 response regulator transcription factor [Staphylococcus pseudintermedius]MDF0282120.1 response regulator transcription factor [Staphylococcus pseudintermedius]MDF0290991.1 response regulator transcription factor [Staphylococcus pseudinte